MDAAQTITTEADLQAVLEHIISGKPLDPEVVRRARERSEKATQAVFDRHGYLNVAVDLLREIRDEE